MSDDNKIIGTQNDPADSLVDALESIKGLLAKSDAKLTAAKESIALASQSDVLNKLDITDPISQVLQKQNEPEQQIQADIPVLNDVVIPAEEALPVAGATTAQDEVDERIPTLHEVIPQTTPTIRLEELDTLQSNLEKQLSDTVQQHIREIELELKIALGDEIDKLRALLK